MSHVTYVPPESGVIKEYAHALCEVLAEGDLRYADREVRNGFSAFLIFVAQIQAKYINSGHKDYLLKGYTRPSNKR
jgi:hypothetical protein